MDGHLKLLARDGMLSLQFMPEIPAAGYGELHEIAQLGTTKQELAEQITLFAKRWNVVVVIED
jgi:hypothetical protein